MSLEKLRRAAEASLAERRDEIEGALYELEVHRIELDLQNRELRRTERALEKARDRWRELFEHAPVAYLLLDLDGRIRKANRRAEALLGLPAAAALGCTLSSFMSPEDADTFHRHRVQIGSRDAGDCLCWIRSGSRKARVRIHSTAADGWIRTVLFDITEAYNDRTARVAAEARLSEIVALTGDLLYAVVPSRWTGRDGRPLWDGEAERVTDGQAWHFMHRVHPDDRAIVDAAVHDALDGLSMDVAYRVFADDEMRWLRDRAFPEVDERGRVVRIVGIVTDVSAAERLRRELAHARRLETIGSFATGIAHDFNNVLQAIVGLADLAARESTDPEVARRHMLRIRGVAKRGGGLAAHLLTFGRQSEVRNTEVQPDQVLREIELLFRRLVGEHIEVELRLNAHGAYVAGDPVQLEQIILNLAANARDAMLEGGLLSVSTEVGTIDDREVVILVVRDTGTGMDAATRDRAFEPYFTTKGEGRGSGIGLSSVRSVVDDLSGSVVLESELGEGTSIRIALPCTKRRGQSDERRDSDIPRVHGTALVVEDDPIVRITLHDYLRDLGFGVLVAEDVHDALHRLELRNATLQLLVVDVLLPRESGPRVADRLRERFPDMRCLFVSGIDRQRLAEHGVPADAVVLEKPFDWEDLVVGLAQVFPPEEELVSSRAERTVLIIDDEPS